MFVFDVIQLFLDQKSARSDKNSKIKEKLHLNVCFVLVQLQFYKGCLYTQKKYQRN